MKFSHKREIDKAAQKATEELKEHLQDVGHKIVRDQHEWMDKMMADLLPPNLYEAGKHGDMEREIAEYIDRNKIQIIFIPDRCAIRIMVKGQIHSQFIPELQLDGEPIELKSSLDLPNSPSNN